jgi:hypothetical protein
VLRAHDSLDAVGDEVSGLQAVTHAPRAHVDGVADPDGVEVEGHHVGLTDSITHGLGEAEQVHVAGVALVPHDAQENEYSFGLPGARGKRNKRKAGARRHKKGQKRWRATTQK